jgi:hypothetical protein
MALVAFGEREALAPVALTSPAREAGACLCVI